ncbi:MAG: hypothetical protein QNJ77_10880 [Acidimicrobiia bacterium]|nr:hypothetical protein [Acidimicrobiia bacterium]
MSDTERGNEGGTGSPDSPPLAGGPGGDGAPRGEPGADEESWPIGFMIILTLAALYLGWRLLQGIGWVIDKL